MRPQVLFHVALLIDVIRWVSEDEVSGSYGHQLRDRLCIHGVSHQQPVVAENPEIPQQANRCFRKFRNSIFVPQPFGSVLRGEQAS